MGFINERNRECEMGGNMPIAIPMESGVRAIRVRADFDNGTWLEAEGDMAQEYYQSHTAACWMAIGKAFVLGAAAGAGESSR